MDPTSKILADLAEHPGSTSVEIGQRLGMTTKGVAQRLRSLRDQGRVRSGVGGTRALIWHVVPSREVDLAAVDRALTQAGVAPGKPKRGIIERIMILGAMASEPEPTEVARLRKHIAAVQADRRRWRDRAKRRDRRADIDGWRAQALDAQTRLTLARKDLDEARARIYELQEHVDAVAQLAATIAERFGMQYPEPVMVLIALHDMIRGRQDRGGAS